MMLAAALHKLGIAFDIYEQAPELTEVGAGVSQIHSTKGTRRRTATADVGDGGNVVKVKAQRCHKNSR